MLLYYPTTERLDTVTATDNIVTGYRKEPRSLHHIINNTQNSMKDITNLHGIEVKKLPATDTEGTKVKIRSLHYDSLLFESGEGITIPYDYSKNHIGEVAVEYLKDTHNITGMLETPDGMILISDTFETIPEQAS